MSASDSVRPPPDGSARLHHLISSLPDGVLVVDQQGMIRYANPAAELLFERPRAALVDTLFAHAIEEGDQREIELPLSRRETRFAEMRVASTTWCGQQARVVTLRDVTERKSISEALRESEERFRSLLQEVPSVAIQGYGLDGRVHYWNKASEEFYGYTEQEALEGNLLTLIIPPEMRDVVREALDGVAEGGEIDNGELSLMRKDGSRISVYSSHSVVRRPGQAPELFCIDIDLTERKTLEEQLIQSQRLESVGQLTGGVAHDFNNLLTVILGNAELLMEEMESDSRLHELTHMIANAARRGAELTQHLLAFARRQVLDPKTVDVQHLVRGMEGLLRRTLGEHIEISFKFGADTWPALVDPGQLEGALLNLALNARDAMPAGGKLTIEAKNIELDPEYAARHSEVEPGAYVALVVSDTGSGVASEHLERVFEPFFTTKKKGRGTGLGLSMVYGFVKQSNGHIKLYSEPKIGTTVKMFLPRSMDDALAIGTVTPEIISAGGNELILVVEDDELVRSYAASQLQSMGYRVLVAETGREALGILQAHNDIDLLFTDIVMPGGMNGRQLADTARKLFPGLKVLFTSGYTENAIVHHGRLDPGVHLLSKPYGRKEMSRHIREVLAEQQ